MLIFLTKIQIFFAQKLQPEKKIVIGEVGKLLEFEKLYEILENFWQIQKKSNAKEKFMQMLLNLFLENLVHKFF